MTRPQTKDFANRGACAKAAKRTLAEKFGIENAKRGEHFQQEVGEDGRWRWWKLSGDAPQENPTEVLRKKAKAKRATDKKAQVARSDGMTREGWLREAVVRLHDTVFRSRLKEQGHDSKLPKHRISCGFPVGARPSQQKGGAIGSCHYPEASADGSHEMFISPVLADSDRVLDVVAHEMCHMYLGSEAKHGPEFKSLATAIGLEGKMTATVAGPRFTESTRELLADMGTYPHAKLGGSALKPKNPVKQIPLFCDDKEGCGVTFRIARKYIDEHGGDSANQKKTCDLRCPACQGPMTIKWPKDRTK